MAKKILEFDYYEDAAEFKMANEGSTYHAILCDFFEYLRNERKYREDLSDEKREYLEEITKQLSDFLTELGVEL